MAKNYEEMSDEEFSQEAPPEIEETSPAEEKVVRQKIKIRNPLKKNKLLKLITRDSMKQ